LPRTPPGEPGTTPPSGLGRRNWQLTFALSSAVAAMLVGLRPNPAYPFIQTAGVVGYALATVLTTGCALALDRPRRAVRAKRR
jgi:hypothetical protein